MAYTHAVNMPVVEELVAELKKAHDDLVGSDGSTGKIGDIFKSIEDMGNSWKGSSYDAFKQMCDSYKESVFYLGNIIDAYQKIFETDVTSNADTLFAGVKAGLDKMKEG